MAGKIDLTGVIYRTGGRWEFVTVIHLWCMDLVAVLLCTQRVISFCLLTRTWLSWWVHFEYSFPWLFMPLCLSRVSFEVLGKVIKNVVESGSWEEHKRGNDRRCLLEKGVFKTSARYGFWQIWFKMYLIYILFNSIS